MFTIEKQTTYFIRGLSKALWNELAHGPLWHTFGDEWELKMKSIRWVKDELKDWQPTEDLRHEYIELKMRCAKLRGEIWLVPEGL